MTTLPNNRDHLEQLINNSNQSLRKDVISATSESYHFVIENSDTQDILGISGIEACTGFASPFYHYQCKKLTHYSDELQIENTIDTLNLKQDHEGCSRLYTLFLTPEIASIAPKSNALSLLSLSRLMFIGQQPQRFKKKFVLELQGKLNEQQESPFWQALGQHFFNMDFNRANHLAGINSKGFIADLMPKYPVYVPLLALSARQVISKIRPDLSDVFTLLSQQGFKEQGYISIFDGGPVLECATDKIHTIQHQISLTAKISATITNPSVDNNPTVLISNNQIQDFRSIIDYQNIDELLNSKTIKLTAEQAKALAIADGDTVFILELANLTQSVTHDTESLI